MEGLTCRDAAKQVAFDEMMACVKAAPARVQAAKDRGDFAGAWLATMNGIMALRMADMIRATPTTKRKRNAPL